MMLSEAFWHFPLPRNKKQPGILVKNVPKSSEAIHGTQFAFTLSAPTTAVAAFTAVKMCIRDRH